MNPLHDEKPLAQRESKGKEEPELSGVRSPSKRRLVRAGFAAVPVVATLASRPAHAWQCRAPSAWSSIQTNPNTSHIGNAGHRAFTDETWTLTNWRNNTKRTQVSNSLPWDVLKTRFGLTQTWNLINVSTVAAQCGINACGANGSRKVCDLMVASNFAGNLIAAQLNHVLLSASSDIDRCVSLKELQMMGASQYPTTSNPWSAAQVIDYLRQNYIVIV